MADAPRCWYQLDGVWHKSVASKLSALHLAYSTKGAAMCGGGKLLYMEGGYTEQEAIAAERPLCKRCLKSAGRKPSASVRGTGHG